MQAGDSDFFSRSTLQASLWTLDGNTLLLLQAASLLLANVDAPDNIVFVNNDNLLAMARIVNYLNGWEMGAAPAQYKRPFH